MTAIERLHGHIHARFGLRVVGASRGAAILVSDTRRSVHRLEIPGPPFRLAWYQAIYDALGAGQALQPHPAPYRDYAR